MHEIISKVLIKLERKSSKKRNMSKSQNRSFEILRVKVTERKKSHTRFVEHNKEIKYKLQNLNGWGRKR